MLPVSHHDSGVFLISNILTLSKGRNSGNEKLGNVMLAIHLVIRNYFLGCIKAANFLMMRFGNELHKTI